MGIAYRHRSMRAHSLRAAALTTIALVVCCGLASISVDPASARARTAQRHYYQLGTAERGFMFVEPLSGTLELTTDDDGPALELALAAIDSVDARSSVYTIASSGTNPDPRSIQIWSGNLLFADRTVPMVALATPDGEAKWTYTQADDPDLQKPFSAQRFTRGGETYTLIADRDAARVWAVDDDYNVVWQYGVTDEPGLGVNHLKDPFYACYTGTTTDTVLIADNLGGNRVIEVAYGDYDASAADNGFKDDSIVWSYGTPGVAGDGVDHLDKAHCAQRLSNGNVLITDAGDGASYPARVIEVAYGDYDASAADNGFTSDSIVWQYGGGDQLSGANHAVRLSDGDTLICDTDNQRVLRVTSKGAVEKEYDTKELAPPSSVTETDSSSPRAAVYAPDGRLVVADCGFWRIVMLGYSRSARVASSALDCGKAGVKKAFVSLTWGGNVGQSGTKVVVEYSLDGGAWRRCVFTNGLRRYDFAGGTVAKTIAYRVTLGSTKDYGHTPVLEDISIQWKTPTAGKDPGGGGGTKPGGTGNSGTDGVYTYPDSAGGSGGTGSGTGSGTYGTGPGAGTTGSGTGGTGDGGAGGGLSAGDLDVPVQSSGSGDARSVQGYEIEGQEGVSGVPLQAEEGAQLPESEDKGSSVPIAVIIGVGLVVAAAFFVPWPVVAHQIRSIASYDRTRARRFLPFRPLGK